MTDTWQDVPAAAPPRATDDWQDVPAPEPVTGTQGISDRLSKGFQPAGLQSYVLRKLPDIASDTAEFFKEGVHQTVAAVTGEGPSQLEDLRPEVERQLISVGRTPEIAKLETEQLMRSWRRQERMGGAVMGPLTALTAPLLGAYRSLISRPLEEAGGPPKEVTEMAGMVAGAVYGLPEMSRTMARVKVTPDGKVSAQAVGDLPKDADFKTAAELIAPATERVIPEQSPAFQQPAAGKVVEAFHGTGNEIKGDFDQYTFFTDNKDVAGYFAEEKGIAPLGEESTAKVHNVKIDTTGFKEYDWPEFSKSRGGRGTSQIDSAIMDELVNDLSESGAPGAIIKNVAEPGVTDAQKAVHTQYIVADSARSIRPVDPAIVEQNLRTLWDERGIHPAEALHDAQSDAFLKHELTQPDRSVPEGATQDGTNYRLPIRDAVGNDVGSLKFDFLDPIDTQLGIVKIIGAGLDEAAQGKGLGIRAYQQLADFALQNGRELWSDQSVSPEAARMYDALERRGYTVERIAPEDVTSIYDPAFKVTAGPSKEAAAPHPDRPLGEALRAVDDLRAANRSLPTEDRAVLGELISAVRSAAAKRQLSVEDGVVQQGDRFKRAPLSETAPAADAIAEHAWLEADQDLARAQAAMAQIDEVKVRHPDLAGTIDKAVAAVEDTLAQRDAMRPKSLGAAASDDGNIKPSLADTMTEGVWASEIDHFIQSAVDDMPKLEKAAIGDKLDRIQAFGRLVSQYIKTAESKRKGTTANDPYLPLLIETADASRRLGAAKTVDEARAAVIDMRQRLDRLAEARIIKEQSEPGSLGAAATDPPLTPLSVQPPTPAGALMASAQEGVKTLFDIGRDIQMKVAPMATGTRDSILIAKDFANTMRKNRWEWARIHDYITKNFTPESWKRMYNAADEESVLQQEIGRTGNNFEAAREHMGVATLEPREKTLVDGLHARAENAWLRAIDVGLVEGEGLPRYTPRMVINAAGAIAEQGSLPLNSIGTNLKATTARLLKRKYLTAEETEAAAKAKTGYAEALKAKSMDEINAAMEKVELVRDIRTLPLAIAQLEDAIAGRTLVNEIKKAGKAGASETVAEGAIPKGSEDKWFTIDHPALKTWRPKFEEVDGKVQVLKDKDGNTIFEQVPIYIRGDFEGPLRAVLDTPSGATYQALMSLKGKTMSVIMYSPAIHNLVEFGRAFPAMPTRIFKAYFDGNRAKNDVAIMTEAIDSGLVPIGKRFFNQDINAIMESPDLSPGRSLTAKLLRIVPDLFDPMRPGQTVGGPGDKVARTVDKMGDFWHNTLLWDRIGDLQMGLYVNLRGDLIGKGVDAKTASIMAAHWANRYAGALPQEAMSSAARKTANMVLFSRSFTMGNLGVMKDMLTGMPKDVIAMIEREGGFKEGSINSEIPQLGEFSKGMAMRKAMAIVALDIALMYVGNSVLQSTFNVMLGDKTIDEETHGYTRRMKEVLNDVNTHPLSLLQPFSLAERLSSTGENEPGRRDRIRIGYQSDGTAIYARNPVGKIGEEFIGYMSNPLEMLRKKEGTIARPALQIFANDKGFGRKVYDPNAETPMDKAAAIWAMVEHFAKAQTPEGQINAMSDLIKGEGDPKTSTLQTIGPFAGVTFSRGAPGGPATGELYDFRQRHDVKVNMALPDIRKQILRGDVGGAMQRMRELDIPPALQRFYIRTTLDPSTRASGRTLRDFYMGATPEQRERLERARQ